MFALESIKKDSESCKTPLSTSSASSSSNQFQSNFAIENLTAGQPQPLFDMNRLLSDFQNKKTNELNNTTSSRTAPKISPSSDFLFDFNKLLNSQNQFFPNTTTLDFGFDLSKFFNTPHMAMAAAAATAMHAGSGNEAAGGGAFITNGHEHISGGELEVEENHGKTSRIL